MLKLQTRKLIALSMTTAYILLTIYSVIVGKDIPDTFGSITSIIIGYYFGKSTALDHKKSVLK